MYIKEKHTQTAQDFLISHLKNIGYIHDDHFETAFRKAPIEKIVSEKDVSSFCLDHPVLFYSSKAIERPIAAPSMICAMVQELDIHTNSNVLILGSGGGFIPTITSKIARKGKITVVEENEGALKATERNLVKLGKPSNVSLHLADPLDSKKTGGPWDRVLITGCIPDLPHEMRDWITIGGVIITPLGEGQNQIMIRVTKGEDGRLSEETMGSVMFVELESDKAKSIKPRRMEIDDLSEFSESFMKYALVRNFPFPIAYVVRSFQNTMDPHSQFTRLLDTHDVTTRFLTTVIMCDLVSKGHKDKMQETIDKRKLDLYKPSLGTWVGALRWLCTSIYDKIKSPFMPELKKAISKSTNKKIGNLVEVRNKYHGHAYTLTEDEYQELVEEYRPVMTDILHTFSFLKEYTLVICDRMKLKGGKFCLTLKDLTGSHTDFAVKEVTSKYPLECEKVFLWRDRDGKTLSLDPLLVFRKCPICKNREIFFYQSSKNGKIEYHGFQNNHKPLFEGDLTGFFG